MAIDVKNEREVQAVKESIKHWEEDIIQPLRKGRVITHHSWSLVWADNLKRVPYTSKDCPLCDAYLDKEVSDEEDSEECCEHCPYYQHYAFTCDAHSGYWTKFRNDPSLENAEEMKSALLKILTNPCDSFHGNKFRHHS